jgi:hypothetical protein
MLLFKGDDNYQEGARELQKLGQSLWRSSTIYVVAETLEKPLTRYTRNKKRLIYKGREKEKGVSKLVSCLV